MSLTKTLQKIVNFVGKTPGFGTNMQGMKVLSVDHGKVRCQFEVKPEHLNGGGTMHGGMICSLVDEVSTYAIGTKGERLGVSVDLNVSFLSAAFPGENIIIESEVLRAGKNLAYANVNIFKEDGKLVASGRRTKYMSAGAKLSDFDFEKILSK